MVRMSKHNKVQNTIYFNKIDLTRVSLIRSGAGIVGIGSGGMVSGIDDDEQFPMMIKKICYFMVRIRILVWSELSPI